MCVCVCVCVWVCMYVYMCVCMYVCITMVPYIQHINTQTDIIVCVLYLFLVNECGHRFGDRSNTNWYSFCIGFYFLGLFCFSNCCINCILFIF